MNFTKASTFAGAGAAIQKPLTGNSSDDVDCAYNATENSIVKMQTARCFIRVIANDGVSIAIVHVFVLNYT